MYGSGVKSPSGDKRADFFVRLYKKRLGVPAGLPGGVGVNTLYIHEAFCDIWRNKSSVSGGRDF
jgi:hypothetical protein